MKSCSAVIYILIIAGTLRFSGAANAAPKINYQDHALPIFRNSCLGCHNPDKKKGGLDLTSWQGAMNGGSDGAVINPGDPDGSLLYRVITHADEPTMPPKRDKLPDAELDMIKRWIMAGALPTASGKPAKSKQPKIDLSFKAPAGHRPDGPPPMPHDLLLESVVHAHRPGRSAPWPPVRGHRWLQSQVSMRSCSTILIRSICSECFRLPTVSRKCSTSAPAGASFSSGADRRQRAAK